MRLWMPFVISLAFLPATEPAREFYAAPSGSSQGDGSRSRPWDLATALRQPAAVRPGATIWLLDGTYGDGSQYFESRLEGLPGRPIIVRQVPGARAIIDGSLVVRGAHTWFWGFDVRNSGLSRTGDSVNPQSGTPNGVDLFGPFTRLINVTVHDTRNGVGAWTPAEGAEIYGCIIYDNGWQAADRGHGHGIYTQNRDARKRLSENVIFNQFGSGIHAYGSAQAFVRNYLIDHNVVFNNGAPARDGNADNILIQSGGGLSGIRVESNYTYHTPAVGKGGSRIGTDTGETGQDVTLLDNIFAGGYIALDVRGWRSVDVRRNTIYSASGINVYLILPSLPCQPGCRWDENRYFGPGRLYAQRELVPASDWKARTAFDINSILSEARPRGVWMILRPNEYEQGRAHLIVYNWDRQRQVRFEAGQALRPGGRYTIRDVQRLDGPPVWSGVWSAGTIDLPMDNLIAPAMRGQIPNPPAHTAPEFAVFLIEPR